MEMGGILLNVTFSIHAISKEESHSRDLSGRGKICGQ